MALTDLCRLLWWLWSHESQMDYNTKAVSTNVHPKMVCVDAFPTWDFWFSLQGGWTIYRCIVANITTSPRKQPYNHSLIFYVITNTLTTMTTAAILPHLLAAITPTTALARTSTVKTTDIKPTGTTEAFSLELFWCVCLAVFSSACLS